MSDHCDNCGASSRSKFCTTCNKNLCRRCSDKHKRLSTTESHILEDIECDIDTVICQVCIENSSEKYCEECKQYMCLECLTGHEGPEVAAPHQLVNSEEKVQYCPEHEDQILRCYCETCNIKSLICMLCISTSHSQHKTVKPVNNKETEFASTARRESQSANGVLLEDYKGHMIKRWSLGRNAKLGQLYNIDKDELLEQSILFDEPQSTDVTRNELNYKPEIKQFDPLSLQSCFSVFGLSSQEKLNVLLHYCKPEGHAAFLNADHLRSYHSKAAGIMIKKEMREETLAKIPENSISMLTKGLSNTTAATHCVVGIEYGITAILIGEGTGNTSEESFEESISKLIDSNQTTKINYYQIIAFMQKCHSDTKLFLDSSYAESETGVSGQFTANSLPNLEEIFDRDGENNIWPIRYTLLPMEMLLNSKHGKQKFRLPEIMPTLKDSEIFQTVIPYFEEIYKVYHQMNEINKIIEENRECLSSGQLTNIYDHKVRLRKTERKIKEKIEAMTQSNKQKNSTNVMRGIKKRYDASNIRDSFLEQTNAVMKKIEFLKELKQVNVKYISEGMTLTEVRNNFNIDTYCAFFFDASKPDFDACKNEFISLSKAAMKDSGEMSANAQSTIEFNNIAADLELNPELAKAEGVPEGNRICVYEKGSYLSCRSTEDIEKDKRENFAVYNDDSIDRSKKKSIERIILRLVCPCNSEPNESKRWRCHVCRSFVQCAADKAHFFCDCGTAPLDAYSFRCGSPNHGEKFITFNQAGIIMNLEDLKPAENINILLLGETGVGKSTLINGIVNYLTHNTLEDALNADELIILVKSSFILTDATFEERHIVANSQFGNDENEADGREGESCTQAPMIYYFPYDDFNVQLIDTPGVGDTRGFEKDSENFDEILKFLRKLDKLHGICILLKPNVAKLNILFRFCISELLTHLHRDAAANIVFCLTNSRSTFYRLGDTRMPLEKLLKTYRTNQNVNIETTQKTIYGLDNESFRFLCAKRQGVKFEKDEIESFNKSWEMSRKETKRLLNYISQLKPHEMLGTLSLNDARDLIIGLAEPIAEISKNITTNLETLTEKKAEIQRIDENDSDLKKKLTIKEVSLECEELKYPVTVCASPSCVGTIKKNCNFDIVYNKECHRECHCLSHDDNSVQSLQKCLAMNEEGKCTLCGCQWHDHIQKTFRVVEKFKEVVDDRIQKLIDDGASNRTLLEETVKSLKNKTKDLEAKLNKLTEINAKFGSFLKQNAITPYNDAFLEYIGFQIEEERKLSANDEPSNNLTCLLKLQKNYKKQVKSLEEAMSKQQCNLTPEDIYKLRDELYNMEGGDKIKAMVDIIEKMKRESRAKFVTYVLYKSKYRKRIQQNNFFRRLAGRFVHLFTHFISKFF